MTPEGAQAGAADLTAVVLCGGRGERLRPLTESLPKPLVRLNGRPLLDHLLGYLAGQGVHHFVLCTGYKAEAIERFVAENLRPGCQVACVNSGEGASMADRILDARPRVEGRALVCYGDTLANVDIGKLMAEHLRSGALATVTVHPLRSPFGVVHVEEATGRVTGLEEKPLLPYWINIGYVVCEPAALELLERGADLVAHLRKLAARRTLSAYLHRGKHFTVNTEKERAEAESEIDFFTLIEGTET